MVGPMDEGTLDALLREAAAWRLERVLSSLPGEEELRAARGPLTRLDRRVARGAAALRRRQRIREERNLPRMSWRRLRRILVAAALLAALAVGTLTVSAELRLAVKNTLVEWGQRNMSIRYEVEGHPLTALPEGYGPHYIPEGFVYSEEDSYEFDDSFGKYYTNEEGYFIAIDAWVAEGASVMQADTEHTHFRQVDYGEGEAWLGTFEDGDGYMFYWFADGIEHQLFINAYLPESEVFRISDSIY